jgi:hypothetical protein
MSGRVDVEELAGDLLARLHTAGFTAGRRGHPELAQVLEGWTLAGCQAVEAGPSAGAFVAKVAGDFDETEMAELVGLGHEVSDVATSKEGRLGVSVPVNAAAAIVAQRAHDAGRRPRWWIREDPVSEQLTAGLVAWREVTFGRPVPYPDRLLRASLIPDFVELDDSEIVARAQELEAFDRAKLGELGGGGGAGGVCEGGTGPFASDDPPMAGRSVS